MGRPVKSALLNLISTPIPVVNGLGLDVAVGLSSEDPIGNRRVSETFAAYLSIYGPDGRFAERVDLGEIPPARRQLFDVTAITRSRFPGADHLVVAHRIPRRLLAGHAPEDVVELAAEDGDFAMYRSLVQFSYPGRANGSEIATTGRDGTARLWSDQDGALVHTLQARGNVLSSAFSPDLAPTATTLSALASTLTFTSKVVVGAGVTTAIVLMNYSVDPAYATTADYSFAFLGPDGSRVVTGTVAVPPFTARILDASATIPAAAAAEWRDARDGLGWFTYVGLCRNTAVIPLILTLSPDRGAVAVEHTHPAQAYTLPARAEDKHKVKSRALGLWAALLAEETEHAAR